MWKGRRCPVQLQPNNIRKGAGKGRKEKKNWALKIFSKNFQIREECQRLSFAFWFCDFLRCMQKIKKSIKNCSQNNKNKTFQNWWKREEFISLDKHLWEKRFAKPKCVEEGVTMFFFHTVTFDVECDVNLDPAPLCLYSRTPDRWRCFRRWI